MSVKLEAVLNDPTAVSMSYSCFAGISILQDTDFILSLSLFPSLPKNNTFCTLEMEEEENIYDIFSGKIKWGE